MPDFSSPPIWWINLAHLTQWLYWPAISAVLSSAAILFTIRLADRGRRDSKRREAAFLRSVAYLVHGANGVAGACITNLWNTGDGKSAASAMKLTFEQVQMQDYLDDIRITDFPDEESLHSFLVGRLSVKNMILEASDAIEENRAVDHNTIIAEARDIDECAQFLRERANEYSSPAPDVDHMPSYRFLLPEEITINTRRWWKFWRWRLIVT